MRYSIITINYNNGEGLRRTIESVVRLASRDFEYIVIDGGSTDGSKDVLAAYDAHIGYWVSESDGGIYNAMNKGVAAAQGDYCIFMNSGDCFHSPTVLDDLAGYHEDIICGKVSTYPDGHHKDTITLVDLMRSSLPHQAMFIRRDLLLKHPYDEHYRIMADWKFCIEVLVTDNCTFRNSDVVVCDYESGGISATSSDLLPQEKARIVAELLPPRIAADYQRLAPVDDELLDQALQVTQTVGIRKLVKRITRLLLRLAHK